MFDSPTSASEQTNLLIHEIISFQRSLRAKTVTLQPQWWIEMRTRAPAYVYYFGPFDARLEAVVAQVGYQDDLLQENAQDIVSSIKLCSPVNLTICEAE